ncbi:MAG: nucleoside deaminase [Firmicutes bacterium]|nr:nucleoside deaminase [Bacillota bacterium]
MTHKHTTSELMNLAIDKARETMNENIGGPFGAVIVDNNGTCIAVASNSVLKDHDPTAHAEINAIRLASKNLGTHDLTGCTLYTTSYPCPMCLGAIIWANIKNVVYGCTAEDADNIGFRDDFIYQFIEGGHKDIKILDLKEKHRDSCLTLFKEYQDKEKTLY